MTIQSEQQLENCLIEQLSLNGYKNLTIDNEDALVDNFREQINHHNAKELKGKELSDVEFDRLFVKITGKSVFNSAKILRKMHDIQRDDGSFVYIGLFNTMLTNLICLKTAINRSAR